MAQVHRFRDAVAVYLGPGRTTYLTPRDAARLAKALSVTARDVKARLFQDSTCGTHELPGIECEFPHDVPPLRRKAVKVKP